MQFRSLHALVMACLITLPSVASADLISVWMAGKGSYVSGTGGVFENLEPGVAGGVELGIEVLNIDLMGEAYLLGGDNYMFTGNIGMDFSLDLGIRATVGAYLTAFLFKFPEAEAQGLNLDSMTQDTLNGIQAGLADSIDEAYQTEFGSTAGELSQWAAGIGPRLRFQLDKSIAPMVYIGVEGAMGWHIMLSGDDVTAEAKRQALNQVIKDNMIPDSVADELRAATGADESIEDKDLNGKNYSFGAYLKLDF